MNIHTYVRMYVLIIAYLNTRIHRHTHTHTHTNVYTHTHTHTHKCIHTHAHTHTHTCVDTMYIRICTSLSVCDLSDLLVLNNCRKSVRFAVY